MKTTSQWLNKSKNLCAKQTASISKQRTAVDRPDHFVLFFTTKVYSAEESVYKQEHANRFFFPSNYNDYDLFAARTKLKYNVRYIYSTTARPEQTQYQPVLKSDKQGNMTTIHQQTCATLCSTQGSSRMARARFDATANLTELNAWLGRWLFEKSGRSLASNSSCSLLSNKVVSATFISGLGLQLSSSTWKKWWQKKTE